MNKTNETTARFDAQDDIIELGVASVETKGNLPLGNESIGRSVGVGITE
jgi:hypothetical protein